MKTKTKVLLTLCCAVLLVAASVMGTLAWLTSSTTVTNTFSVGKVVITMDELETNTAGTPTGTTRVQGNEYKLLPGHEYTKDPIIHVDAASEDCYLFVTVDNQISAIEDSSNTVESQMVKHGWKKVSETGNVWYYCGTDKDGNVKADIAIVSKSTNVPVFDKFKVAGDGVTNDILNGYQTADGETVPGYANKQIVVTAYAIQADGMSGKTVAELWNMVKS